MKIFRNTLLAGSFVLASAVAAHAHAQLQSADPRVGSVVRVAPPVLTLSFSEGVEPALSSAQVTDAAGRRVDAGRLRVDRSNPQQVQVPLKSLPPGQYTVHWRVVSVDTHTRKEASGSKYGHDCGCVRPAQPIAYDLIGRGRAIVRDGRQSRAGRAVSFGLFHGRENSAAGRFVHRRSERLNRSRAGTALPAGVR